MRGYDSIETPESSESVMAGSPVALLGGPRARVLAALLLFGLGFGLALFAMSTFASDDIVAEGSRSVVVSAAVNEPAVVEATVDVSEAVMPDPDPTTGLPLAADSSVDASVPVGPESVDADQAPLQESVFVPAGEASDALQSNAPAISQALGDGDEGRIKFKVTWLNDQKVDVETVTGVFVEAGDAVHNGDRIIEVSGRPIFVFEGLVPATRSLESGDTGDDVAQLETALASLGYGVGVRDGVFDGALSSGLAAFYADNGYSLPDPEPNDLADVRKAETDLAELAADRQQFLIKLDDATKWGAVDDGFQRREEAEIKLDAHNAKIARLTARMEPAKNKQARLFNLIGAINGSYASGNFGFLETDELPLNLTVEFKSLVGDDTDDYLTIDAIIDSIEAEIAKVEEDVLDFEGDIADERADLRRTESEFRQLERERYIIEDASAAEDIRLDIAKVDIKVAAAQADLAQAQQVLLPRLSIDEYVFVPGLAATVDEVKVGLRDPADSGTLVEIVTGGNAGAADAGDTKVTADGEVAVDDAAAEDAPEEDAAEGE